MADYNEMTDFEINKRVAEVQGRLLPVPSNMVPEIVGDVQCYYDEQRVLWECHLDYCGSAENAWPIIVDVGISLLIADCRVDAVDRNWICSTHYRSGNGRIVHVNTNPLRAAMIVFLMMKEAE